MKNPGTHAGHKQQARELAERRTRSHKSPISRLAAAPVDRTICLTCGSVFHRKTWRRTPSRTAAALAAEPAWGHCPACAPRKGEAVGRVILSGRSLPLIEDDLRRRIDNVCERAAHTQPERRVLDVARIAGGIEVDTNSQALAHRIARELEKAFGGRAYYVWRHRDGHLLACWEAPDRPDVPR
jgi:hypothetical protein